MAKFKKEVDCIQIVNSLRQLKAVVKMMLSEQQQTLTRFHQDTLIRQTPIKSFNRVINLLQDEVKGNNIGDIPRQDWSIIKQHEYETNVKKFIDKYKNQEFNDQDYNLIKSII